MTPRAGIVAVAAAVLAYLATWALLFVVSLYNAANVFHDYGSGDPLTIPPPNSWALRAVYFAVAILVGLRTLRACRERELSRRQATVPVGLALAAVLVVSGSRYAVGVSHERSYLERLPPGMSRAAGLVAGHQACDWLAAQGWGRPSGSDQLQGPQGRTLVYQPAHVRWHWANSTDRLVVSYLDHLDAQHPGPLTRNEQQQASVTAVAWFELCPFQQWVHRPVSGGGSD